MVAQRPNGQQRQLGNEYTPIETKEYQGATSRPGPARSSSAAPRPAHGCLIYPHLISQLPCTILDTPETPCLVALSRPSWARLTSGDMAFVGTRKCLTPGSQASQLFESSFLP